MVLLNNNAVKELYRELIKEAERFPQYNFRMYAQRKIKHEFEKKKDITEENEIDKILVEGRKELDRLRRMTTVASIYAHDTLIIEKNDKSSKGKE